MRVISLFDGISCGRVALERAGLSVESYFASEIDNYAIRVSKKNWPGIIQVGDVTKVRGHDFGKIDLLLGGPPCQGFSSAGKGLNFADPRSKLFFEYVRILGEIRKENPDALFLLENVRMKKEHLDRISSILGVEPIMINSALVSAQDRKRWFWTNIKGVGQPEDKGILLKDIVEPLVFDMSHVPTQKCIERILRKKFSTPCLMPEKSGTINTKNNSGQWSIDSGTTFIPVKNTDNGLVYTGDDDFVISEGHMSRLLEYLGSFEKGRRIPGNLSRCFGQGYRCYGEDGKTPTIQNSSMGGIGGHTGLYLINQKAHGFNNGGIKFSEKSTTVTTSSWQENNHLLDFDNYVLRKLTPVEVERLFTLPDNYTDCLSNSRRYQVCGNGWVVDVIAHILSYVKV